MDKLLIDCLQAIEKESFKINELAYLALTSKIENPIRDRWAFQLHNSVGNGLTVAREWKREKKRIDIAILNMACPKVLIELTAMYTFDLVNKPQYTNKCIKKLEEDEEKARKLSSSDTEIYTVLLATHPKSSISIDLLNCLKKYSSGINRAFKRFGSPGDIKNRSLDIVEEKLSNKNVISINTLLGGSAFGIEVEVLYWIIKAQ
jgi:hypothetical protein